MKTESPKSDNAAGDDKNRADPVDFSELREMIGVDDPRLAGEVLKIWLKTFPPQMDAMRRAAAARDRSALKRAAHAAKSAAQQAAAFGLGELITALEEESGSGGWDRIERRLGEMAGEEARVRQAVKAYLNRHVPASNA